MKSKILLFLTILFIMTNSSLAQPECKSPVNPFYICLSDFKNYDHLFYGEIVSQEFLFKQTTVNSTYTNHKAVIKVDKSFRGKLPKNITLYLSADLVCPAPSIRTKYLFYALDSKLNGEKVYFTDQISRPMTDYSAKAVKEVFAEVNSALNNEKKESVDGVLFEALLRTRESTAKAEDQDRLSRDIGRLKPLADVLIEVTSESDGTVYQIKSKADGTFKIDRVPNGIYKIKLNLPPHRQIQRVNIRKEAGNTYCSRKWVISVTP